MSFRKYPTLALNLFYNCIKGLNSCYYLYSAYILFLNWWYVKSLFKIDFRYFNCGYIIARTAEKHLPKRG